MKASSLAIIAVLVIFSSIAEAAHDCPEKWYQERWCTEGVGVMEYVLDDGTRVDCLMPGYAVEFDFAEKWAEAIGQALYYGRETERSPGVVLILEGEGDGKYLKRLQSVAILHGIKVWTMEGCK